MSPNPVLAYILGDIEMDERIRREAESADNNNNE
jgi:hypothetical protein